MNWSRSCVAASVLSGFRRVKLSGAGEGPAQPGPRRTCRRLLECSPLAVARTDPEQPPGCLWLEGLEPGVQEAEFVAFWVGQNVPALGAALADVGGSGAESEQPIQLGVLVAVGGVDVDVQPELPGPRVGTRAEDEGRLQAAEAGVRRPDLDAPVVFPSEFDIAEDLAPERGEPAGIGGVDDQLTDAACHARQCRQATRKPIADHVEGGALRDRALPGGTGSCPAFCACEEGTGCGSPVGRAHRWSSRMGSGAARTWGL